MKFVFWGSIVVARGKSSYSASSFSRALFTSNRRVVRRRGECSPLFPACGLLENSSPETAAQLMYTRIIVARFAASGSVKQAARLWRPYPKQGVDAINCIHQSVNSFRRGRVCVPGSFVVKKNFLIPTVRVAASALPSPGCVANLEFFLESAGRKGTPSPANLYTTSGESHKNTVFLVAVTSPFVRAAEAHAPWIEGRVFCSAPISNRTIFPSPWRERDRSPP